MLHRRGVVDERTARYAAEAVRPLTEHLADCERTLAARGRTVKHTRLTLSRLRRVVGICRASHITDLTSSAIQHALASLRAEGIGLESLNHHARAVRGFSRWLLLDGRTQTDILAAVRGYNAATDRRHVRRALSEDQLGRLLRATQEGPTICGMAGPDRAMLYTLATGTGFRVSELRSLMPGSVALETDPPTVTVEAAYSKRRRRDTQLVPQALAAALRVWIQDKPWGEPVLAMPNKPASMMRRDLEAAGVPYRDETGAVADFHSLRHTYVTRLVHSGLDVKLVQHLARHSTPVLTLGRYTHVDMSDAALAVKALGAPRQGPDRDASNSTALGTALTRPDAPTGGLACPEPNLDNPPAPVIASRVAATTWHESPADATNEGPLAQSVRAADS